MPVMTHFPPCEPLIEVQEFMNGNGKPGAKTRLALLEGDVKNIKDNFSKMTNWIVGAAITLMTGGFLWILNQIATLMQKAK